MNFHDNANTGQWILDNRPTIAKAVIKSIVETLDLQLKPEEEEVAEYLITDEKWRLIVKTNEDETLPINEETIHSVAIMGLLQLPKLKLELGQSQKGRPTGLSVSFLPSGELLRKWGLTPSSSMHSLPMRLDLASSLVLFMKVITIHVV